MSAACRRISTLRATMLPQVSRTFAPGIDVLPGPLADPVRLAYLLCRVADTIEDAPVIVPLMRHRVARPLRGSLVGSG